MLKCDEVLRAAGSVSWGTSDSPRLGLQSRTKFGIEKVFLRPLHDTLGTALMSGRMEFITFKPTLQKGRGPGSIVFEAICRMRNHVTRKLQYGKTCQLPSSAPPFALGPPERAGPGRSFVLSKLWKKSCRTSCWGRPFVGLGVVAIVGDVPGARPVAPGEVIGTERPDACGREERPEILRAGSPPVLELSEVDPPRLIPPSISESAFSTLGRLKLLVPIGPTIPIVGFSVGFLKAPRGSLSVLLEFSS